MKSEEDATWINVDNRNKRIEFKSRNGLDFSRRIFYVTVYMNGGCGNKVNSVRNFVSIHIALKLIHVVAK